MLGILQSLVPLSHSCISCFQCLGDGFVQGDSVILKVLNLLDLLGNIIIAIGEFPLCTVFEVGVGILEPLELLEEGIVVLLGSAQFLLCSFVRLVATLVLVAVILNRGDMNIEGY
jgi:hypothetical protein